jgi:hypothetical protein
MMPERDNAEFVDWLNLVPAIAMALIWLVPMVLFWGIVFGPLRPMHSAHQIPAPHISAFLVWCGLSLMPCVFPDSYYRAGQSKGARRVYEFLGIRYFKRFVANGDLVNHLARSRIPQHRVLPGRGDLAEFAERTRAVERAHLVLLLFSLFTAIYSARVGSYCWAVCLIAGNVVCNLYPVLLQRYNRARIRPQRSGLGSRLAR